jgi:hypothetical protein
VTGHQVAEAAPRLRRRLAAAVLVLLAACGKKTETSAVDEAYNSFKYRNFILGQTFPGGRTLDGSIDLDGSRDAGGPSDWIEVAVNGDVLGRSRGVKRVSLQVKFRPGPNKVSFFFSGSRRHWDYDVIARQNTRVEITPKDQGEWNVDSRNDD